MPSIQLKNRGVSTDSQRETKDGQGGKPGLRRSMRRPIAENLAIETSRRSGDQTARGVFAGERGCAHAAVGGIAVAGFLLEHLAVEVHFFGKFGGLATLAEEIEDAANQAHDITFGWRGSFARTLCFRRLVACGSGGELVVAGAAIVFRGAPFGGDPAVEEEALEGGVQGAFADVEDVFGDFL